MVTGNKPLQNSPLPASAGLPEVDLFIIHEESTRSTPASHTPSGVSREALREAEPTLQKILFGNKIAELSSRIARELNNPLATVLIYVQLLLANGKVDEITREGLETINREAQHATDIITGLLSFTRKGKPEREPIYIQEIIQKSLDLHIPRLSAHNVELVVNLQPDIPRTMADPDQMQKVFANIITNAEQAMMEAHGKGRLHVKAQISGDKIRITFEDDGPGIKPSNLKNVFEPFFTTRETGLGLGLSICCAIIEVHGGSIYAMNRSQHDGAIFVVELPIIA